MKYLVVAALALAPAVVGAQELGPVVPAAPPGSIEVAPPSAPIAIRQEDAARLSPTPSRPTAPKLRGPSAPVTIQLDESRPPENDTPRFILRDVTDRTEPRVKALAERAAAVERLRRSLGTAIKGPTP